MIENQPESDLDAGEPLDAPEALGPDDAGAEDLDLNGSNDWEFVP